MERTPTASPEPSRLHDDSMVQVPGRSRLIVGGVAGLACLVAVELITFAGVARRTDSARVMQLVPFDAGAKAILALTEIQGQSTADIPRVERLARQALARDPLSVNAISALALSAAARGDTASADRRFRYVDKLTHRSLVAQLWFIERSVEAGNIPAALERYDSVLRVFPESTTLLYPVLIGAVSEADVARELNALLRKRPIWSQDFLLQLIAASKDSQAIANTASGLLDLRTAENRELLDRALARFVVLGDYDRAWALYSRALRQSSLLTLRDGSFSDSTHLGPFEWADSTDPESAPERRSLEGHADALFLPVSVTKDAVVTQQVLHLKPGSHVLTTKVGGTVGIDPGSLPQIQLLCAAQGQMIATQSFPTNTDNGSLRLQFEVPAGCAFQTLAIVARVGEDALPGGQAQPWITNLTVNPA